jgi:hypothetical protein
MFSTFSKILITVFVLAAMAGLTEAQTVRDGLISYWSFNEDTIKGNIVSDLWGDNDGEMINDPLEVEGIYGEALEFTGDNHVDVPDSDSLQWMTGESAVTAWALRTGPGETERGGIVEKGNGGIENTPMLLREWTAGTVDFEVRICPEDCPHDWFKLQSDSIALIDDEWVFLAGTFDGQDQKIYVNGVLDGTLANPGGYGNNDWPLRFGWDPLGGAKLFKDANPNPARHFVGVIDEIAIYDRALTPDEINQNMGAVEGVAAVDPAGKLSSTWGEIKAEIAR